MYSGDNKVAIPTFAVASLIVALEFLMTYHFPLRQTQIVKGEYLRLGFFYFSLGIIFEFESSSSYTNVKNIVLIKF